MNRSKRDSRVASQPESQPSEQPRRVIPSEVQRASRSAHDEDVDNSIEAHREK